MNLVSLAFLFASLISCSHIIADRLDKSGVISVERSGHRGYDYYVMILEGLFSGVDTSKADERKKLLENRITTNMCKGGGFDFIEKRIKTAKPSNSSDTPFPDFAWAIAVKCKEL